MEGIDAIGAVVALIGEYENPTEFRVFFFTEGIVAGLTGELDGIAIAREGIIRAR